MGLTPFSGVNDRDSMFRRFVSPHVRLGKFRRIVRPRETKRNRKKDEFAYILICLSQHFVDLIVQCACVTWPKTRSQAKRN